MKGFGLLRRKEKQKNCIFVCTLPRRVSCTTFVTISGTYKIYRYLGHSGIKTDRWRKNFYSKILAVQAKLKNLLEITLRSSFYCYF